MKSTSEYQLVLASTSPYRRELISRLGIDFQVEKPTVDEERLKSEKGSKVNPQELAEFLALKKAESLRHPRKLIIGGDQLVAMGDRILGKPGSRGRAIAQLTEMCGKEHLLITSMALVSEKESIVFSNIACLKMKTLSKHQIERIIDLDQPFDCAGAYKLEKHGIALFERIECDDFTAIQGVPLLKLAMILQEKWGIEVLI